MLSLGAYILHQGITVKCLSPDHLQVVALHRDHYVFPLTIAVTKVSGSGADGIFMGVLKPLQDEADLVRAWIMPAGVCVCRVCVRVGVCM